MVAWIALILPFALVFARTTACVAVMPVFGSRWLPLLLKAGIAAMVSIFMALRVPPSAVPAWAATPIAAGVLVVREVLCGAAIGLAAQLVFLAIQQGGILIGRQMGFYMASILDPSSGQETQPFAIYLETLFILLFLAAGGHHLLLQVIARSFTVLPVGGPVDFGMLASGVLSAGTTMLLLALKLAAPVLAAFLVLSVILGVLARVMPEMNILLTSLPLRVALGLLLAMAIIPLLQTFTEDVATWITRFL